MPHLLLILSLLVFVISLRAQHQQVFYIGHSLSDQVPDMVKSLSQDHDDVSMDWRYQWIPGAPLRWQWQRMAAQDYDASPPHIYPFYHPSEGLPAGNADILVLTESVPRYVGPEWGIAETYLYADSFYRFATDSRPDIRVFLYEVWHCLESGTPTGCDWDVDSNPWRQRLDDDLPMWESVVDFLNDKYNPEVPVCLIPGGQGLARLADAIEAGTVPGLSSIEDLFSDDIHLTDQGKYFIACIHFAMIHNASPVGLTHQTQVWWGGEFEAPTPAQAARMQEIALETVTLYPNTCFHTGPTSVESPVKVHELRMWPNPVTDRLLLEYEGSDKNWQIVHLHGLPVGNGFGREVDVRHLMPGMYFLQVDGQIQRFIKN